MLKITAIGNLTNDVELKVSETRVMVLTAAKETTPQHKPPHPHKYRRGVER